MSITAEQVWASDIQMAVKKGWIRLEGKVVKNDAPTEFRVTNISKSRLTIDTFVFDINDMKYLTETQIAEADVQKAIELGLLEVEQPEEKPVKTEVKDSSAVTAKVKEKMKKTGKKKVVEDGRDIYRPEDPETTMQAWDAKREKNLTKEELKKDRAGDIKQIDRSTDLDTKVGDVDFTKQKKVVGRRKRSKTKTTTKTTKKKNGKKTKKTANKLKPVGRRRPAPTADGELDPAFIDADNLPNEVDFVDHEQEVDRINQHPRLREKAKMNEAVDLDLS